MNRVYLTKEGYEKLRSELEKLEKEEQLARRVIPWSTTGSPESRRQRPDDL